MHISVLRTPVFPVDPRAMLTFNRATLAPNHLRMPGRSRNKTEAKFYRDLGQAIRLARVAAGKTEVEVAPHLEISYQQLQKYEKGTNRIPVDKLVRLAAYLDTPLLLLLSLPEADAELLSLTESLQAKGSHAVLESWAGIKHQPMRAAILNVLKCAAALSR